jgi:hypothetical protein
LVQSFSLLLHHEDKLIISKNRRSGFFTSIFLVAALRVVSSAFGRLVRGRRIANLLSQIHLLGVKLVELILGASGGVLLLLLDLEVSDLRLLHHMLKKHLLIEMTGDIGFVRHVNLFGSCAAGLISASVIQTLNELGRLSPLITKKNTIF